MTVSDDVRALLALLVTSSAEDIIIELRQMCIERESRIDGEWGLGNATQEQLGEDIDTELAQRLFTRPQ